MNLGLIEKEIENKSYILVDRFDTKDDELTVGDFKKLTEKQKEKYKKEEK